MATLLRMWASFHKSRASAALFNTIVDVLHDADGGGAALGGRVTARTLRRRIDRMIALVRGSHFTVIDMIITCPPAQRLVAPFQVASLRSVLLSILFDGRICTNETFSCDPFAPARGEQPTPAGGYGSLWDSPAMVCMARYATDAARRRYSLPPSTRVLVLPLVVYIDDTLAGSSSLLPVYATITNLASCVRQSPDALRVVAFVARPPAAAGTTSMFRQLAYHQQVGMVMGLLQTYAAAPLVFLASELPCDGVWAPNDVVFAVPYFALFPGDTVAQRENLGVKLNACQFCTATDRDDGFADVSGVAAPPRSFDDAQLIYNSLPLPPQLPGALPSAADAITTRLVQAQLRAAGLRDTTLRPAWRVLSPSRPLADDWPPQPAVATVVALLGQVAHQPAAGAPRRNAFPHAGCMALRGGPYVCTPIDVLHVLDLGMFKYFVDWVTHDMSSARRTLLDRRVARVRAFSDGYVEFCGFPRGYVAVARMSGKHYLALMPLLYAAITSGDLYTPTITIKVLAVIAQLLRLRALCSEAGLTAAQLVELRLTVYTLKRGVVAVFDGASATHFNFPKFHALDHLADCVELFGVPQSYSTSTAEQRHVETKSLHAATNQREPMLQVARATSHDVFLRTELDGLLGRAVTLHKSLRPRLPDRRFLRGDALRTAGAVAGAAGIPADLRVPLLAALREYAVYRLGPVAGAAVALSLDHVKRYNGLRVLHDGVTDSTLRAGDDFLLLTGDAESAAVMEVAADPANCILARVVLLYRYDGPELALEAPVHAVLAAVDADADGDADADAGADGGAQAGGDGPHALSPSLVAFKYYSAAAAAGGGAGAASAAGALAPPYETPLVARRKLQGDLRTDPIAVVYRKVRTLPICDVDRVAHVPDEVLCSPRLFNR